MQQFSIPFTTTTPYLQAAIKETTTVIGPYWWPDPEKEDGLPYIRRDGVINPEYYENTDNDPLQKMSQDAKTCAIAYALTKNEEYAAHATAVLETFFVNEATRMNPNLQFGQGIPGITAGRCFGIIETFCFSGLVEALPHLRGSESYTQNFDTIILEWFTQYHDWLTSHPLGIEEGTRHNNHSVTYDVQCLSIAQFIGRDDWAENWLEQRSTQRIEHQIEEDGSMPLELARTRSWDYTTMNTQHFFELAMIAERYGIDFYSIPDAESPRLKSTTDFALPYVDKPESWDYQQIKKWKPSKLRLALTIANSKYEDPKYTSEIERLGWQQLPVWEYLSTP